MIRIDVTQADIDLAKWMRAEYQRQLKLSKRKLPPEPLGLMSPTTFACRRAGLNRPVCGVAWLFLGGPDLFRGQMGYRLPATADDFERIFDADGSGTPFSFLLPDQPEVMPR